MNANVWVKALQLKKHPEGGYFKETYRADKEIIVPGFEGLRAMGTAIYYLLESGQYSAFHRIKSDEIWHFYAGSALAVHVIDRGGKYHKIAMGRGRKQTLQAVVKAQCWFAASVEKSRSYSLVGCTVSPGFDFHDWEKGRRRELLAQYPEHKKIILEFTRQ